MNSAIVLLVLGITVGINAGVITPISVDTHAIPNYKSSYHVSDNITGDKKSASETRVGDITKGSYSVLQPDGVLRTVIYTSSPQTGFQAQVINTGKAIHPPVIGGRLLHKGPPAIALLSPAISPAIVLGSRIAVAGPGPVPIGVGVKG